MKLELMTCIILFVFAGVAQFIDPTTTVIVETPARYQLMEGIDVAINNVMKKGKTASIGNVLKELEEMQRAHDVKLPYSYNAKFTCNSRGKSKASYKLSQENQRRKTEFEAVVKRRIQAMVPDAAIQVPSLTEEPRPRDFKSREEFIKAYVLYKTEDIDEETKQKYAKKLGGLSQYKRDVKNEAAKLWKENQL